MRGLLVRHLVLPEGISGTEGMMRFLSEEISKDVHVSLMSQYFPAYKAAEFENLSRRITAEEYEEAHKIMEKYGLENGWVQELE
jgi:putative pyruvate formate lyase activating enzyme